MTSKWRGDVIRDVRGRENGGLSRKTEASEVTSRKKGIKMEEEKVRTTFRMKESTYELMKQMYKKDNCGTKSEFMEKAVLFYIGHLTMEENKNYFSNIVTSTLKSIVNESDNRQNRILFKLAVEMAMMMNVIASSQNIDSISLARLRGECVKEVKRTNGTFSLEDAFDWQKG